jgi:hypothetical protein
MNQAALNASRKRGSIMNYANKRKTLELAGYKFMEHKEAQPPGYQYTSYLPNNELFGWGETMSECVNRTWDFYHAYYD